MNGIESIGSRVKQGGIDAHPVIPVELSAEFVYQTSLAQSKGGAIEKARDAAYLEGGMTVEEILCQTENDARGHNRVRTDPKYGAENLLMYEGEIRQTRDTLQHLMDLENPANPTGLYDRIDLNLKIYNALVEKIERLKGQDIQLPETI